MTGLNFSAQHKLLDPAAARSVTQIGVGAVGSWAARMYAKMGVSRLRIWDDDDVSEHNVPMSCYRPNDVAKPKVGALTEILANDFGIALPRDKDEPYDDWIARHAAAMKDELGFELETRRARYDGSPLTGVVVACVDSMESRQEIWKQVRMDPSVDLLVDTRTAAELLWVFAICPSDPDDIKLYEHHLDYGSKDATPHFCGQHGIMPVSYRAAGAVGSALTSWWMCGKKKRHHKELVGTLKILT